MSKNAKNTRKLRAARQVTETHKAGGKIGRSKKLHTKVQIYPKGRKPGAKLQPIVQPV